VQENMKIALVLGGGGSRGAYEIGVWQALREMDIHIDIITGSSVGAINGAMIAQNAFDLTVSLWNQLETDMIFDMKLRKKGDEPLKNLLTEYIDEYKIRKSKIEYGLATVEIPSLTPHYLFKDDIPDGKLVDFILASASLFPALKAHDIDNIKYADGGYLNNIPVDMALQKGATHVIAVDLQSSGIVRKAPMKEANCLIKIQSQWDLGNILVFKGSNSTRIMRLGYLDTLKVFGFYDGSYYCFPKGHFNKRTLESAESAGKIFGLNPGFLYSRYIFNCRLKSTLESYRKETERERNEFHSQIKNRKFDKDMILSLLQKINQRTLTIILADYITTHSLPESTLITKPMLALFKEEFKAANYLIKEGLL
jgi:NTE family protein